MELFKSRTRVAYTNAVGDKVYPVVVDIKKGIKSTEDIQFVSSDVNTGILSVAFISGNENFNVSGADVVCSVMRPDASTLELPCEVVRENIVEVPLGINGTSQDGVYSFDFKVLKGGNKIVGTPIMNYSVSLSIGNDMVIEEDDRLPVLTMLMTQVNELKDETRETVNQANVATEASREATANAIEATNNANAVSERVSQETATAISEIKQDTENAIASMNQSTSSAISTMNQNTANAIANVNATSDTMVENVNNAISSMDTTVNSKISEMTNTVNNKISEVNTAKNEMINDVSSTKANMVTEVTNAKNEMTTTVTNKVNEVEGRFNALTASQQQSSEVIDARDGETSLKARLDRDIEKAKQVYVNVEGSNISTDSSVGYAKDVEIFGNTIQDASNLADIRSVGDKVEGQELYEIPVLSVGKNLLDYDNPLHTNARYDNNGNLVADRIANTYKVNVMDGVTYRTQVGLGGSYYTIWKGDKFVGYKVLQGNTTHQFTCDGTYDNVRYSIFHDREQIDSVKMFYIYEGKSAEYEPYQEDKLTILSPVQLEKVGDVADRIICKDGVWGVEKNIKTRVYTENDNWHTNVLIAGEGLTRFAINEDIDQMFSKPILNSFAPYSNTSCTSYDVEKVFSHTSAKAIHFIIRLDRLEENTVSAWKKFVAKNHITAKYIVNNPQFIPLPHSQQVKLRTFANKTNISFLTEIEGTIKAQVPKSLGATVNTHTEQISNLNKELDRVKKLEESTVSTVETENDFTTVEATSNGYFEDVKLEGKTLVNLLPNTVTGEVSDYSNLFLLPNTITKSNTYTLIPFNLKHTNNIKLTISSTSSGENTFVSNIAPTNGVFVFKCANQEFDYDRKVRIRLYVDNTVDSNTKYVILEGDHTQNPPSYFEGLKSVGDGSDGILVESVNSDSTQSDKKPLLYYNNETQAWEKPILREWDSIEKHADGKYYYHQRSGEVVLNGSEDWRINPKEADILQGLLTVSNIDTLIISDKFKYSQHNDIDECIWVYNKSSIVLNINKSKLSTQDIQGFKQWLQANPVTVVYQLAQEKVYECTNIDLITYANETNFIVESGVIAPRTTLKVHNNISNVVSLLQKKVSLLESNVKASQEVQDMMILETDMRMLDIELALMEFAPMTLNLGGSNMLRSATYFNFLKNHIINETYEKGYLENVMNKYLATGRINQDEYDELYKMLYPPVYDIELPIEL